MKNIILIGMPGTGKSTVGVILAKNLGYGFTDTDILIAEQNGAALPELIKRLGYKGLIELEGKAGRELSCSKTVIATGGSMVFSRDAMTALKSGGAAVWLRTELDVLRGRLSSGLEKRGVAAPAGTTLEQLAQQREPYYARYADYTVDCAGSADDTAQLIQRLLTEKGFLC